jgi:hypothetical protein
VRIRWNHRVRGKSLHAGRYVLVLEAMRGHRVVDLSNATTVTLH